MISLLIEIVSNNFYAQILIAIFFGMMLGSFSTAIIYRENSNQSWIWNNKHKDQLRSFCPRCHHTLGLKDLIPIFSWILQKGRCRYCHSKIANNYILLELSLVVVCLAILSVFGLSIEGILFMILSPFLVSQFVLFFKYKKISKMLMSIIVLGVSCLLFVV